MLTTYVIGRAILRAVFNPRSLPLAWPLATAAVMILGLLLIAAVYVAAVLRIARWALRKTA